MRIPPGHGQAHQEEALGVGGCRGKSGGVRGDAREAALAYAEVAKLDPTDPRWRRCWRALRVAAIGMVAEIREPAGPPEGHPPPRALASRRSATPATLRRLAAL